MCSTRAARNSRDVAAGESRRSGGESCEWHLREEKSNNMYLLPLFPLEKGMARGGVGRGRGGVWLSCGTGELGEGEECNQ